MKSTPYKAAILVTLIWLGGTSEALAETVKAYFAFDEAETINDRVQGSLTLEIHNLTGIDLNNVDVRLADGGSSAFIRGVLQLGALKAGAIGIATGDAWIDQAFLDQSDPLPIRIDFDAAVDEHHREWVTAEPTD